jgi:hypothetical protein
MYCDRCSQEREGGRERERGGMFFYDAVIYGVFKHSVEYN